MSRCDEHLPALEDIAERKGNGWLCNCANVQKRNWPMTLGNSQFHYFTISQFHNSIISHFHSFTIFQALCCSRSFLNDAWRAECNRHIQDRSLVLWNGLSAEWNFHIQDCSCLNEAKEGSKEERRFSCRANARFVSLRLAEGRRPKGRGSARRRSLTYGSNRIVERSI